MKARVAFLAAALSAAPIAANCNRPAEPGVGERSDPPSASAGGYVENGAGGSPADDPGGGGVDARSEPTPSAGGAPDAGVERPSEAGAAGAPDSGTLPHYDPAVIMDDGVLHVWTLGDSITVGVEGGFRNDIYNMLTADGYEVDLVGTQYDDSAEIDDGDHEGHTAYTFDLTREDVDGWLAAIHRPDVVLMLLGSNDFAWWTNEQPSDHLASMLDLVDHLLAVLPGAAVVVATLPPQSAAIVEDVHRDRNEMVSEFNELVLEALPQHEAYGEHVFLADVHARIDLSELYDGIHPTREAHREVAEAWYDVLKQILP